MIGLDTNVLIRHVTQDDPTQSRLASSLIDEMCSVLSPGFINDVVLCEAIWVLESSYKYERTQIASWLEELLRAADIEVESPDAAWAALARYRKGSDFSDALIGLTNQAAGVVETVTFDRKAAELDGFALLTPNWRPSSD